jgi:hypothetical protein
MIFSAKIDSSSAEANSFKKVSSFFGQPVATRRRTRLEGVLAVLGEIRGSGPVWDVESGGTVCALLGLSVASIKSTPET